MGYARHSLVCLNDTPYYHVIARCVRRAWLWGVDEYAGRDYSHRKEWVIERLQYLSTVFAIDICAYAVMSNHYHLVLHVDQERAKRLSDLEIIERWSGVFGVPTVVRRWKEGVAGEAESVAAMKAIALWRSRLVDVSWFMRCLNEYLARRANAEDQCTGRFWGVPRTLGQDDRRCCGEDEGRPLGAVFQRRAPNRPLLLRSKERGGERVGRRERSSRQVSIEKMSESELPMTCRNTSEVVETGGAQNHRE
jgi:hypothetical protein